MTIAGLSVVLDGYVDGMFSILRVLYSTYRETSNRSRTLLGYKIVYDADVVGASSSST